MIFKNHSLSIRAAAPIPVPMHIETNPNFLPVLANSGNKVAICLEPKLIINYLCNLEDDLRQLHLP
jgi:hypothetical protein